MIAGERDQENKVIMKTSNATGQRNIVQLKLDTFMNPFYISKNYTSTALYVQ
jgi:hypothetical protein